MKRKKILTQINLFANIKTMKTKKIDSAKRLRLEMARLDLTREQVGKMFSVTPATVSSWRRGHTEPPYVVVRTLEEMGEPND